MTITTARRAATRRPVRKSHKPARTAEGFLPMVDDKLDLVAVLLAALTVPGQMSNCYSRFHRYSFLNMVLVFMQTGQMEPMANYKKWVSLGRNIIRGSKALFVNHPVPVYKRDEAGNLMKDKDGRQLIAYTRFVPKATVFQLSQTDGPELSFPELPAWDKELALKELDIKQVRFNHHDGNTQGYSTDRKVALNPVAAAPFKTLIHEMAHVMLGHTTKDGQAEYQTHRGVMEFQAESVALLVCRELAVEGFDESASRAYIQGWLGGKVGEFVTGAELVDNSVVRQIFSVTDKILVAGRKGHFAKLEAEESAA